MSKPMSEQMQQVAARYEKATGKKFDQITNADHIRAMTDEELAKFSAYQMSRGDCWGCPWFWPCDYEKETCTKFFLDWLKQPYGGDT